MWKHLCHSKRSDHIDLNFLGNNFSMELNNSIDRRCGTFFVRGAYHAITFSSPCIFGHSHMPPYGTHQACLVGVFFHMLVVSQD